MKSFFYKQFSEHSKYDKRIDENDLHYYVIEFHSSRIFSILKNINPNKARYLIKSMAFFKLC